MATLLSKASRFLPAMLVVLLVVLTASADACPMCKAALAGQEEPGGDVISGFFYSILFMLSMPFAILGVFSGMMYREVRKARAAESVASTSDDATSQSPPT